MAYQVYKRNMLGIYHKIKGAVFDTYEEARLFARKRIRKTNANYAVFCHHRNPNLADFGYKIELV